MDALITNRKLTHRLPTKSDILDFYDALRDSGLSKDDAIMALVTELFKTWTKADCPPLYRYAVKEKI